MSAFSKSIRRKVGAGLVVAVLASCFALPASAQLGPAYSQGEYCTEGYFAILMVEAMKLNVRQTWNKENAVKALQNLGIEPLDGWDADATLNEATEVFLLRFIDIPIYTANPEREVTILEARSIINKYHRRLVQSVGIFTMGDDTTATTIDEWTMEHPSG